MKILAVDTSSRNCSVSIVEVDKNKKSPNRDAPFWAKLGLINQRFKLFVRRRKVKASSLIMLIDFC